MVATVTDTRTGYGVLEHYNGAPVPIRLADARASLVASWIGEGDLMVAAGPCGRCGEAQAMLNDYLCGICASIER